jgi:hypothetical protein
MLKFAVVNPIVAVLVAIASSMYVMVGTLVAQVAPVAMKAHAQFARPPPSSGNVFMHAAQRGAAMSGFVVGIAVAALIVAILIPIAFGQFFSVVTTSWDAQTVLLWGIVPLVIILALVLYFLNKADDQA